MRSRVIAALLAAAAMTAPGVAQAAPGDLDRSFGTGGFVVSPFGDGNEAYARGVATDAQGRTVVAGYVSRFGGGDQAFVARYLSNGTPDTAFGAGGVEITSFGATSALFRDAAVLADGRIVAAGMVNQGGVLRIAIARFTASGALDPSFGTGGLAVSTLAGTGAYALAVDPDGRLVVAGRKDTGTGADMAVARFTADGAPDPTFGPGPDHVVTAAAGSFSLGTGVVATAGGILVVGGTDIGSGQAVLERLLPDGSKDPAFGTGGMVITGLPGGGSASAEGLALQPDGGLLVTGRGGPGTAPQMFLARVTSTGAFDPVFGTNGVTLSALGDGSDTDGVAAALQPDGRIVVAGLAAEGVDVRLVLMRYLPDGKPDPSFGNNGAVLATPAGAPTAAGQAVAVASDGRLTVSGYTRGADGLDQPFVARFLGGPYPLTVQAAGTGQGKVTSADGGIACPATCSHDYDQDTKVTLTATPAAGSQFAGWSGGGCSGTAPCTVTMGPARAVTATFTPLPVLPLPQPDTRITGHHLSPRTRTLVLRFRGDGGNGVLRFQCRLDRRVWRTCSSPIRYRHLRPGRHRLAVRAVDSRGIADPSPAGLTVRVPRHHR